MSTNQIAENITDFHSHALPGMDDGSKSPEQSLEMLRIARSQGVAHMVLTPHFYPTYENPETFIRRRHIAARKLYDCLYEKKVSISQIPQLYTGAEVAYFDGISFADELELLKIKNTNLLLLEMPFCQWSERMFHEVRNIYERHGITVIIAHIERYLKFQKGVHFFEEIEQTGALIQANSEFFISRITRRKALKLLKENRIHCLGSDCHNLDSRPPNIGKAVNIIKLRAGDEYIYRLNKFTPTADTNKLLLRV